MESEKRQKKQKKVIQKQNKQLNFDKKSSNRKTSSMSNISEMKPIPQINYYKDYKRAFTISIVVPSSIIDKAQSLELKTYLVGQIAKAASLYNATEIIILSDDSFKQRKEHIKGGGGSLQIKENNFMTLTATTEFFVKNLEYVETPQYLRRGLFPKNNALRCAGIMNPLETKHHLKVNEWFPYREGAVIKRPTKDQKGSWVNIGLAKECQVDISLMEGTRVTVKLHEKRFLDETRFYKGTVVSTQEPFTQLGTYWGYNVRVAMGFDDVFNQCPFVDEDSDEGEEEKQQQRKGGYDLTIGISDNGKVVDFEDFTPFTGFKHALVFFGGLDGIEGIIDEDETSAMRQEGLQSKFDLFLNTTPERGTRSIRTEESMLVSLAILYPKLRSIGFNQ